MIAVGMRRIKLSAILLIETAIIGVIGILAGILTSIPLVMYFHYNPIPLTGDAAQAVLEYNMEPVLPFALEPGIFLHQSIVVIIITLLTFLYPFTVVSRFKIINAIKGK